MLSLHLKGYATPNLSKRATIYFDPAIHRILKVKAAETSTTVSGLIDAAIRRELSQDLDNLPSSYRKNLVSAISYDKLLANLKKNDKI